MTPTYVHTCIRVLDIERSLRFYSHLGFEHRGRLNFGAAYNVYLGLPGEGDTLELTVNVGREEPYDIGDGYGHMALVVDDLYALLERLDDNGIQPERPPYNPGERDDLPLICFVQDPDGYRVELIDKAFATPQDPPKEEWVDAS
jgi:lactoylglutathione lyase